MGDAKKHPDACIVAHGSAVRLCTPRCWLARRPPRRDEEAVDASFQPALGLHPAVERQQPLAVGGNVEAIDLPGRDAQVHHHRADIDELAGAERIALLQHLQTRVAQLARGFCGVPGTLAQHHRLLER